MAGKQGKIKRKAVANIPCQGGNKIQVVPAKGDDNGTGRGRSRSRVAKAQS